MALTITVMETMDMGTGMKRKLKIKEKPTTEVVVTLLRCPSVLIPVLYRYQSSEFFTHKIFLQETYFIV